MIAYLCVVYEGGSIAAGSESVHTAVEDSVHASTGIAKTVNAVESSISAAAQKTRTRGIVSAKSMRLEHFCPPGHQPMPH